MYWIDAARSSARGYDGQTIPAYYYFRETFFGASFVGHRIHRQEVATGEHSVVLAVARRIPARYIDGTIQIEVATDSQYRE
jgi:hypothetical protein